MSRPDGPRRVLVVATAPDPDDELHGLVRDSVGEGAEVLVVAPASDVSFLQWLAGEEDHAREEAARRAERVAEAVPGHVVDARVGDMDPVLAIEDALRTFPADEVIVVTRPEDDASWLAREAVGTSLDELGVPVTHVVDDAGGVERHLHPPVAQDTEGIAGEFVHARRPWAGFLIESTVLVVVLSAAAVVIAIALLVYFLAG